MGKSKKAKNIAILGAGIIGLCTAERLVELKLRANITILSKSFLQETTSDGAGGIFRPDDKHLPGCSDNLIRLSNLKRKRTANTNISNAKKLVDL